MASDVIYREDAKDYVRYAYHKGLNPMEYLDDVPTADVALVVHGEWIPVTNGRGGSECNMCHVYAPSYQSGREYNSPYCPNCGARMCGGATDIV